MEAGRSTTHQQQIREIFNVIGTLTRDMEMVKQTLENILANNINLQRRTRSLTSPESQELSRQDSRSVREDLERQGTSHSGSIIEIQTRFAPNHVIEEDGLLKLKNKRDATFPVLKVATSLDSLHEKTELVSAPTLAPLASIDKASTVLTSYSQLGSTSGAAAGQQVILNLGGTRFYSRVEVLSRVPNTKLAMLAEYESEEDILQVADRYDPTTNEYYFDRRPRFFSDILNLYESGKLHVTEEGCMLAFMDELSFWMIDERMMESCCHNKYMEQLEVLDLGSTIEKESEPEIFPKNQLGRIQKKVWDLFEHPASSIGARIIGIFSIFCIFVSTAILTLDTLPYFQKRSNGGDYPPFVITEAFYMTWFTLEFLIRLMSSPSKIRFIKNPLNVIDLLAILPYFINLFFYSYAAGLNLELAFASPKFKEHFEAANVRTEATTDRTAKQGMSTDEEVRRIAQFLRLIRIVKMFRIIRIFKLARHSGALQALGMTVKNSYRELGMLILFMTMGVLMFSSLVYTFENDEPGTTFETMLDAYWWALVTMTTVGYGDISPTSGLGRVIGAVCATFGVLVIALPIPIIGNQFGRNYQREQRLSKMKERLGHSDHPRKHGSSPTWTDRNDTTAPKDVLEPS